MIIRRLSPSDAADYRRLRLRGLRESPAAFGSSYSVEAKRPLKDFVARLKRTEGTWTFGTFEKERLVGVISIVRNESIKERHKALIFGMYVDRKMRRKGTGRELLRCAVEAAKGLSKLRQVQLAVVEANRPALRLYQSAGFKIYGREEAALFVAGKFYSEPFLARRL